MDFSRNPHMGFSINSLEILYEYPSYRPGAPSNPIGDPRKFDGPLGVLWKWPSNPLGVLSEFDPNSLETPLAASLETHLETPIWVFLETHRMNPPSNFARNFSRNSQWVSMSIL